MRCKVNPRLFVVVVGGGGAVCVCVCVCFGGALCSASRLQVLVVVGEGGTVSATQPYTACIMAMVIRQHIQSWRTYFRLQYLCEQ